MIPLMESESLIVTVFFVMLYDLKIAYVRISVVYSRKEGGAVASWLVRSTPERAVRVRALAGVLG